MGPYRDCAEPEIPARIAEQYGDDTVAARAHAAAEAEEQRLRDETHWTTFAAAALACTAMPEYPDEDASPPPPGRIRLSRGPIVGTHGSARATAAWASLVADAMMVELAERRKRA